MHRPSILPRKGILSALGATALILASTALAQADTVGYWRFEESNLTLDSGPNGINLAPSERGDPPAPNPLPTHYTFPELGAGSAFRGSINGNANTRGISGIGTTQSFNHRQLEADISGHNSNMTSAMSIEAFVHLSFSHSGSGSAIIASQGMPPSSGPGGWALSVTSEGNSRGARNILFQTASGTWGGAGFSTLQTNVYMDLNKDYYIGLTVDFTDSSSDNLTLYIQNLTDNGELQIYNFTHTGVIASTVSPFIIGAQGNGGSPWYGLIDEVRLSDTKLIADDLLINNFTPIPEPASVAAIIGAMASFVLLRSLRSKRR